MLKEVLMYENLFFFSSYFPPFLLIFSPFYISAQLSKPLFLSQAGAGGASLQEDFSFLLNPATISLQTKNKGALAYTFKKQKQKAFFSFADLKTQIPLALSYQREWSQSFKKSEKETLFFTSGLKLSPYFGLGAAVEKDLKTSTWNGSIGSILRLGNQMGLALFLNDIFEKKNKKERSISLALYYKWKILWLQKLTSLNTLNKNGSTEELWKVFYKNFFLSD